MSPEAPGEDAHVDVNMIYSENKTQFSHDNIFIIAFLMQIIFITNKPGLLLV